MLLTDSITGRIKKCSDCRSLFVDEQLFNAHKVICNVVAETNSKLRGFKTILTTEHRPEFESNELFSIENFNTGQLKKPVDMVKDIAVVAVPQVNSYCAVDIAPVPCHGCGQNFSRSPLPMDDKYFMNVQYLNHCVFKCSKYNQQVFCTKCNCYFLNDGHFKHPSTHGCPSGQENVSNNKSVATKTIRRFGEFPADIDNFSDIRCCAQCDIFFVSPKELGTHFKNFHSKSLMYNCLLCSMTFRKEKEVNDHAARSHPNAGKMCVFAK